MSAPRDGGRASTRGAAAARPEAAARRSRADVAGCDLRIERGLVSPSVDTLAHLLDLRDEELVLGAAPIDYGHDVTLLRQNRLLRHAV